MKRNTFNTKRLVIRPYTNSDYKEWSYAYTQCLKKKSKYDRGPMPPQECSKAIFNKVKSRQEKLAERDHTYVWAIFDKKTGVLIGTIDIFIICRDLLQMANIGYRIFNLYWRQGFASEALKAAIPKILLNLKLNRLQAVIDHANIPSVKLAKKLMKPEGTVKNYYYQDKKWDDQLVFSATRNDLKLPILHPKLFRP